MQHAAQNVAPLDRAVSCHASHCWHRALLITALVGARLIGVVDVRRQHVMEMPLTKDQDLVQTFLAHRAHPAFREGSGVGSLDRRTNDRDRLSSKHRIERRRKRGITVVDEDPHRHGAILHVPSDVPRLLDHPGPGRVGGAAGQVDTSAAHLDEAEDIERLQPCGFRREAGTGQDLVFVVPQEGGPSAPMLGSFRCWWDTLPLEHIPDG